MCGFGGGNTLEWKNSVAEMDSFPTFLPGKRNKTSPRGSCAATSLLLWTLNYLVCPSYRAAMSALVTRRLIFYAPRNAGNPGARRRKIRK